MCFAIGFYVGFVCLIVFEMQRLDLELLRMLNAQFLLSASSFQSVFRTWSHMHPEELQQNLLCGSLGTLERNNVQRLQDFGVKLWRPTRRKKGCFRQEKSNNNSTKHR